MTSPQVWDDAFARARYVGQQLGQAVLDPLQQNRDAQQNPYWIVETSSGLAEPMEIGQGQTMDGLQIDQETGQIWLHLMVPKGSISTAQALPWRKAMSNAFRRNGDPPAPWAAGLYYDTQQALPPDLDQEGNWYVLSLAINYRYQDGYAGQKSP